jgi:hypothetical protein
VFHNPVIITFVLREYCIALHLPEIRDSTRSPFQVKTINDAVFSFEAGNRVHFTGYYYKIPGYEFSKHGLNVQK